MTILSLENFHQMVVDVLVQSGTSPKNANSVADALSAAEADGLSSHGSSRILSYAEQVKVRKIDGIVDPEVSDLTAAACVVDARSGFAYPAIEAGIERALEKVKQTGIAAVTIKNSHHSGALGYHVEKIANRGYVSLFFSNSPAGIAPWGGTKAVFGTNPVGFGCPRKNGDPLVVDLSLATIARGKIVQAAAKDEAIPEGWAIDENGHPTTDAKAAMKGTNLPMGGAKGAALVLVVELLAAALTGSQFGFEASSFLNAEGEPPHIGQFFMIIDPKTFAGDGFVDRVEMLLAAMLDQPGTRLPGARRLDIRKRSKTDGVEIADTLIEKINQRIDAR